MKAAHIPNLVLGTGPAAIAAAYALRRHGIPFEVLDVAYDLEPERESMVRILSATDPADWAPEHVETLFPPTLTSARGGVEKRLSFGSNFPYQQPECISCSTALCTVGLSHGLGGFGSVWGAAMLPYTAHDLNDWPISPAELADSYKNVAQFVPVSADVDHLAKTFPIYHPAPTALTKSEQTANLLAFLNGRGSALRSKGIDFGRSRVAVDSSGGPSTCRYCGHCLEGCPYGSLFGPRLLWKKLEQEGIKIHKGFYALEFQENADSIVLSTVDVRDGTSRSFTAGRLFVGLGAVSTTRFIARSLKLFNRPIRIQNSQYFFFPLLSYRRAGNLADRFTLAEIFLDILNSAISDNYVHFQIYGLNQLFRQTLSATVPSLLRSRLLLDAAESRFYLCQGFLHSSESGHLDLTVSPSQPARDDIHIQGVTNPVSMRVAKRAQAILRRNLTRFGMVPPLYLAMVPPGRSFHAGGSFPMGGNNTPCASDLLCRPAGLSRTHILDASSFPSIPATTITFTAMANSDRVINEAFRSGYLS